MVVECKFKCALEKKGKLTKAADLRKRNSTVKLSWKGRRGQAYLSVLE